MRFHARSRIYQCYQAYTHTRHPLSQRNSVFGKSQIDVARPTPTEKPHATYYFRMTFIRKMRRERRYDAAACRETQQFVNRHEILFVPLPTSAASAMGSPTRYTPDIRVIPPDIRAIPCGNSPYLSDGPTLLTLNGNLPSAGCTIELKHHRAREAALLCLVGHEPLS